MPDGRKPDVIEPTLFDLSEFGDEVVDEPITSEGVFASLVARRDAEAAGPPLSLDPPNSGVVNAESV